MTPLDKTLKRLIDIKGDHFVVTLTPDALKVTRKGHQRGVEMRWESLVSGESALAVALQASVGKFDVRQSGQSGAQQAAAPAKTKEPAKAPPRAKTRIATATAKRQSVRLVIASSTTGRSTKNKKRGRVPSKSR